jgi:hypothetical protein
METATFNVNRGSDLTFEITWPDGAGGAADLTGYTVGIFEPSPAIAGLVTATMDDPATGVIRVRIEWADGTPCRKRMTFRVSVSIGDEDQTTNLLAVIYK